MSALERGVVTTRYNAYTKTTANVSAVYSSVKNKNRKRSLRAYIAVCI